MVFFRASTCTGKSKNIPSSHPCIVYLHFVESMEDTGKYANRSYMDGMDYRYIKTFPRDRIDAEQSLHLDFCPFFFRRRWTLQRHCLWSVLSWSYWRLLGCETLGVHFPCSDGKNTLSFQVSWWDMRVAPHNSRQKKNVKQGVFLVEFELRWLTIHQLCLPIKIYTWRGPPYAPCYMGKSTRKIDRYCPLAMQGFSNLFRVVSSDYGKPCL